MTNLKSFQLNLSIFFGLFLIATSGIAADWPTYRNDNARTGCTSESLTGKLKLQWVNITTGDWGPKTIIDPGKAVKISAPGPKGWAAAITSR